MYEDNLRALLSQVKDGTLDLDEAIGHLKTLPFENLGFAKIDHHRKLRNGFPEVIYCEGKTVHQTQKIAKVLARTGNTVLATRASEQDYRGVLEVVPEAVYYPEARCIVIHPSSPNTSSTHYLAIVTAGTSDIGVAEEAAVTAEAFGNSVERIYDVGVAGIHRLFAQLDKIRKADVIIVIAGMEGALASVVGGLVDRPVIAVPTSVGYGSSFNGLAALLSMLNSCSSGVSVVNIDNGFGAAYNASLIIKELENRCQL
ncbi:nickel pincer cofactor biosynthesis protein LarB [Sporolactobacillus shoreicorticis]|uniref:Nickel pincer cofactor biosynthesis protein LarB n=1 Tax=Sporolactobacillus shoreicorticis TaxID=1923877 RepID=A0ABW5RYL8_9BACL|nr:nickel pincer cofactor biosynthesis protein LarB [Sporolactobacillus shoreicorticis]MCO7125214.1 nickel pincer cofactor biosynthesis protein LarB [Sporolactobacillus shoreicorticis]